jgi:predicted Zn-dependent peptidase
MSNYFSNRYAADNMVLAVAGPIDFEKVISEAQRLCGEWPRGKPGRVHTAFTPTQNEFTQIMPNTNRAYIGMMMPAPALGDMRRYASSLISQIVGDREGSKFYWSVVETGLAEEASCSFEGRDGLGEYLVFAACESQNVAEVEKRLHAEMSQLSQTLQQDELDRARARIATGIALAGERPSGRMHRLGSQWAYGLPPIPIEKEMERIENLTLQDLRQCLIDFPMKPVVIGRMLPPAIKDH